MFDFRDHCKDQLRSYFAHFNADKPMRASEIAPVIKGLMRVDLSFKIKSTRESSQTMPEHPSFAEWVTKVARVYFFDVLQLSRPLL